MLAIIATIPVTNPTGIVVSPDGTRAYVASSAIHSISVIDTVTNTVIDTIAPGDPNFYPDRLAIHPDGTRLYVNRAGGLSVVDLNTKTVIADLIDPWMGYTVVHPDGTKVYRASGGDINGNADPKILVLDAATNAVVTTIPVDVSYLAISPDGTRLYAAGDNAVTVSVIDTATHALVNTIDIGDYFYDLVASPDGTRLYLLGSVHYGVTTSSVIVVDLAAGAVITKTVFPLGMEPSDIAVAPDSSAIYVPNVHGIVSAIDAATMTVTTGIQIGEFSGDAAVTPDGCHIYVSNHPASSVSVIAQLVGGRAGLRLPDLVGRLFGGVAAGGGGWIVIGDHFYPIPPRPLGLDSIARAAAPHVGRPIENRKLGEQLRKKLDGKSKPTK